MATALASRRDTNVGGSRNGQFPLDKITPLTFLPYPARLELELGVGLVGLRLGLVGFSIRVTVRVRVRFIYSSLFTKMVEKKIITQKQ